MSQEYSKREEAIYYEAVGRTADEREAYLRAACAHDVALLDRVRTLLKAHEIKDEFLESAPWDTAIEPNPAPLTEDAGTVIGRYKLLEKIGEGGMAVVYMAEQVEPICRKVALKIIKLGMDTREVIARFEAERQALALMDHPSIARVFDAGATETGRPYFVMELVTGVSITEYCDKNNLKARERLALFVQVCNAVQHAHEKGVVHRDIKPSNVMVTHHDGKPVPKIIDFGIAKATNQKLTEKTLFTRYAHIIGTPAYMSPEQAELSDLGIDARSDIYSLGVLLYELLTGTTPFGEEELRHAGYLEMQRIIREEEPARPSTKLSTLGETLTDIAKCRGCTPELLRKTLRGDLDWIVMKSLEKDRTRRYEEASGLALDIQRHLEHRPVTAHAPSAAYRLQKFLRRNRLPVGVGLAAFTVVGALMISVLWNHHQVQRGEAEGVRQVNVLAEARKSIKKGDLSAARKALQPILESKHVGLEARTLFADTLTMGEEPDETAKEAEGIMARHYRERVQFYTAQIAAHPNDPNNYLRRAQQYHYLGQTRDVQADMIRYAGVLGKGQFPMLLFGPVKRFRPVIDTTSRYQFVLSIARREDGIVIMSIAFGQKGRSTMKRFEIPMLLASLFGACFIPGFDTPVVLADFTFGTPVRSGDVVPILDPLHDGVSCLSYDGLEMHISSDRPGGYGDWDLWVLERASVNDSWGPPQNLGSAINSPAEDSLASISSDGLTLYFNSNRSGGCGSYDVYMTTRPTRTSPWGQAVNLGPTINTSAIDGVPWISPDGLELYFGSYRSGGYGSCDIYVAKRTAIDDPWGDPVNLGPVINTGCSEHWPSLSPDGLILIFSDHPSASLLRSGGYGSADIWMSRRATAFDPWQAPVNLGPQVNGATGEVEARISSDGHTMYFRSNRGGTNDNWQAPIIPVVDFNGDGKVDGNEVLNIVEYWGEDDSLYDIGPSALGDGVIDANDLIALADYIGTAWDDPTLLAHWEFEEGVGNVTMDWVGGHDAVIVGEAVWESDGRVGGALAFDGRQNLVRTVSPVLDPAMGPFSAIAWVKGGATNRVIVSQVSGADWLYVNSLGMLATDLKAPGASGRPLTSAAYVLDDQWHRVALVWDGVSRSLYMDGGEVVAEDVQPGLVASNGNLQMGCGNNAASTTLWSGLIDDVRIYNRVVRP